MSSELVTPPATMEREDGYRLRPLHLVYGVLGLIVLSIVAFATLRPIQVLPRITLAPGFALTDETGSQLTNEDMRGSLVLYNFVYSTCGAACDQTNDVMQAVQARLDEVENRNIPIEFVTISVDPERDTPAVLQAYAESWGADTAVWHFVTGPVERLRWIIGGGFGVYFNHQEDGAIKLDPAFMLVDGAGILRAEYRTATPEVERILRDLRLIIEEAENSEGAGRYAYEAAHLFLCYPR